jgi:Polyprenyl synthetase
MEYYLEKTYCKTASMISNSCKAVAILAGQTAEVSTLAYEYGRNLVSVCTFLCRYPFIIFTNLNNFVQVFLDLTFLMCIWYIM